jgi:hypothetical protein
VLVTEKPATPRQTRRVRMFGAGPGAWSAASRPSASSEPCHRLFISSQPSARIMNAPSRS